MQTSDTGTFPTKFGQGFSKINQAGGIGEFYKGLSPLWMRQVPYTMVKFAAFENTVKAFYKYIFTNGKETYSKNFQLMITFISGYWAGIFCALVSHPADTMVSIINKRGSKESALVQSK
jgi:solute carrier family 25 phosphate transporter 3